MAVLALSYLQYGEHFPRRAVRELDAGQHGLRHPDAEGGLVHRVPGLQRLPESRVLVSAERPKQTLVNSVCSHHTALGPTPRPCPHARCEFFTPPPQSTAVVCAGVSPRPHSVSSTDREKKLPSPKRYYVLRPNKHSAVPDATRRVQLDTSSGPRGQAGARETALTVRSVCPSVTHCSARSECQLLYAVRL